MQATDDRIAQDLSREASQEVVASLQQLPGLFGTKSRLELLRLLADCPVNVQAVGAREALHRQGDVAPQVRAWHAHRAACKLAHTRCPPHLPGRRVTPHPPGQLCMPRESVCEHSKFLLTSGACLFSLLMRLAYVQVAVLISGSIALHARRAGQRASSHVLDLAPFDVVTPGCALREAELCSAVAKEGSRVMFIGRAAFDDPAGSQVRHPHSAPHGVLQGALRGVRLRHLILGGGLPHLWQRAS